MEKKKCSMRRKCCCYGRKCKCDAIGVCVQFFCSPQVRKKEKSVEFAVPRRRPRRNPAVSLQICEKEPVVPVEQPEEKKSIEFEDIDDDVCQPVF